MVARRSLVILSVVLGVAASACGGGDSASAPTATPTSGSPSPPGRIVLAEFASGFDRPVDMDVAPDGTMYVTEKGGLVSPVVNGRPGGPALLDLRGHVSTGGEQGLLSIAFDPESDGKTLYADYTDLGGNTRVVSYHVNGGRADPSTGRQLLAVAQPYANHNGGDLVFGPDGLLYIGLGDGGSEGDPNRTAQDPSNPLGKLLRLDVSAADAKPEMFALGLRNPWRFSFDRANGDLWIGDVGQNAWEEIDRLPAGTPAGANFGWSSYEGSARYNQDQPADPPRLVQPVGVYGHDQGCSVTGGFVYRGRKVPQLRGAYVFGDYCSGLLWTLRDGGEPKLLQGLTVASLTSFAEDRSGELYALSDDGTLYRFDTKSPPP
jgi:glucose/arabinose dehydrogenase